MKKLAFIIVALLVATAGYTQVIYNDGGQRVLLIHPARFCPFIPPGGL
jgi:hypothetical protein